MNKIFCKTVLSSGGEIVPLIIPGELTGGTGLMNPSIFIDGKEPILNLRHVNYTLYHCEGEQLFNNRWGPLAYLNPENDIKLRTKNFLCKLNDDLSVKESYLINTSRFDIEPLWEFIGLEDTRLFRWCGNLYICGVRRDVKPNGEGRMELSGIAFKNGSVKEISRSRIEPPNDPNSYCEKNWMPIIDMPFHFVKWTNPTEVIKIHPAKKSSETVFLSPKMIPDIPDLRGGSQVISWGDYHICIVHEVSLWKNKLMQKDAQYVHRFIVWDKDWNIVKFSDSFSFMDGEIEFCCGMALYKDEFLISFGFQDNAAFIIRVGQNVILNMLDMKIK